MSTSNHFQVVSGVPQSPSVLSTRYSSFSRSSRSPSTLSPYSDGCTGIVTGLKIASLDPQQKFGKILQGFGKDIENVQKLYQRQKNDPPCARMLPPISGKIAWARQLFRKIEQPMLVSCLSIS